MSDFLSEEARCALVLRAAESQACDVVYARNHAKSQIRSALRAIALALTSSCSCGHADAPKSPYSGAARVQAMPPAARAGGFTRGVTVRLVQVADAAEVISFGVPI